MNHPLSRGSIVRVFTSRRARILTPVPTLKHIKSNDPLERPVIDPHYFEEEYGNVILERP
jgi:hypothetical protein